ncbi:MAG: HD domain-containing protein [Campylobacterales bacterium]|nr:HD domain-containing protein [Campylobacterales bacterium]
MYLVNIREICYALSEALDYVGIDDVYHGKRVAYMASKMYEALGYSTERIDSIIIMGMLHDCGVSNTDIHHSLVKELDWEGSQNHCIKGAALLQKVSFYEEYAAAILYHHTHWSHLKDIEISQEKKEDANTIFLVDRVDALRAQNKSPEEIIEILKEHKGSMFETRLVELFEKVSSPESFWFYLEENNVELFLQEWIHLEEAKNYSFENIKEISLMFSDIVDAKSSFTAQHSLKVSQICLYLGQKLELAEERLEILELAALLHDLGKLRIADSILEKRGPLNQDERKIMDRHSFDSEMILRKINGFKEVAELAASHHETLDGKGYPYQKDANSISLETRILTIGDIFQALAQNRPYRKTLELSSILKIMQEMESFGKLDNKVLNVLQKNAGELYTMAVS